MTEAETHVNNMQRLSRSVKSIGWARKATTPRALCNWARARAARAPKYNSILGSARINSS